MLIESTIFVTVVAGVEPVATYSMFVLLINAPVPTCAAPPDTIRVTPFIEKDPDGEMNGAKLALEITREAVVAKIPL